MATKTYTLMHDDLDGSAETADSPVSTVDFALDGQGYEIDLNSGHAAQLRDALANFVAAARKATGKPRATATTSRPAKGTSVARADREQNQAVRDWARSHGAAISDRGRIPAEVMAAYHLGAGTPESDDAIAQFVSHQQARISGQIPQGSNGQVEQVPETAGV